MDIDAPIVWPSLDDYPANIDREVVDYIYPRGVFPAVALARGYRSVRPGKPGPSSDDQDYSFTYGFTPSRGGIVIPLFPLLGGDQRHQIRNWPADIADKPRVGKFLTPKGQRNCLATSPVIPPELLQTAHALLFIAEGVTRVDALAGYGLPSVAITGKDNWKGTNEYGGRGTALPDFDELAIKGGRQILAFDGDIKTKPDVAWAAFGLKRYLLGKGSDKVFILALPDGLGLDDWIARERFETPRALLEAIKSYCLDDEQEVDLAKELNVSRRGESLPNTTLGQAEGLERLSITVRNNARTLAPEWSNGSEPSPGQPTYQLLTDYKKQDIISQLEENFVYADKFGPNGEPVRFQPSRKTFDDRLNYVLHHNTIDPVQEWLESLPEWDRVSRLDTLYVDALGVPDDELVRAAAKILIVAARRCFEEAKYDHMPILIGKQGVGKTSFVRHLLPQGPDYASWFADAVELGGKERELQEKAGGAVVVEWSEMSSSRSSDRERVKTLITQTASTVRLSYRHDAERHERRYIIIGTANPSDWGLLPPDPTGYRRYIPLNVSDKTTYQSVTHYLDANREQLWAEALARHRAGEPTHLSKELERETSKRASEIAPIDVLSTAVEDLTYRLVGKSTHLDYTTQFLMAEAGLVEKDRMNSAPRAQLTEFAGKLRAYKWEYGSRRFGPKGETAVFSRWLPPAKLPASLQSKETDDGPDDDDTTIERCYLCNAPHEHPDKSANRVQGGNLRCSDTAKCSQRATTTEDKGE